MKKILISVLLVSLAFAAFADDAKVLPEGVLRATFANVAVFGDEYFDADGKKEDGAEVFFDKFAAALEFGVTDTVSAAIQWTPAFNIAGEIDGVDDVSYAGLADLFIGAKVQVYNDETMRFCFAPGIAVPLDKYDLEDELDKSADGDDPRLMSQSTTESIGLGFRLYFDYQVTDEFYVNFYNQTRYYFSNERYASIADYVGGSADLYKADIDYPIYLDFELEPHYDLTLSKTGSMGFGLPVDLSMNGKMKQDGDEVDDSDSYELSVNPGISFFYTGGIPFEVAANYSIPLMGKNVDNVVSMFTLKVKLFYDFY